MPLKPHPTDPDKMVYINREYTIGQAPIRMEGGLTDPDEFEWQCNCEDCAIKYEKWKGAYDIQQKQLRGNT